MSEQNKNPENEKMEEVKQEPIIELDMESDKDNIKSKKKFDLKSKRSLFIGIPIILLVVAVGSVLLYQKIEKDKTVSSFIQEGNRYLEALEYEQAIASYMQAVDIAPKNQEANMGLAQAYEYNGEFLHAESVYANMLKMDEMQAEVYEKLAELYLRQEKLEEAKKLLEEAKNKEVVSEELTVLYYITRPEPPVTSYTSGTYGDRIRVELTATGGQQTIYYTLDGAEPTAASEIYSEPLILGNGVTTIKAMVINSTGYQSDIAVYEYDVTIEDVEMQLQESKVETIIREQLNLPNDKPIYNEDIEQITEVYIIGTSFYTSNNTSTVYFEENQYTIDNRTYKVDEKGALTTLEDLKHMPFLKTVVIAYQEQLDISALKECTSIENLAIVNCGLLGKDLDALSGLTNLKLLNVSWNQIHDISALSSLTGLTSLGVWGNLIREIDAVSSLSNLTYLDFSDNYVEDITPVAGLTNLKQLWMYHNFITDVSSVSSLANLQVLMIRDNPIIDYEPIRDVYPHLTKIDEDVLDLGGDEDESLDVE